MSSRDELNDLKRRVERVENTVLAPGTDYVLRTESEQAVTCWRDLYHKVAERRNALQKELDEAKAALDNIRRARIGDSERLNALMTERDTARENVRKLSDQLVNPPLTPAGERERVIASAWAEYERVKAPALAEYERVKASAWFAGWKRDQTK